MIRFSLPPIFRSISACLVLVAVSVSLTACPPRRPPPPPAEERAQPAYFYHTIKYSGETLSIIAGWYTGAAGNWRLLLDHNPGLDPRRIRIGQEIAIPEDLMVRHEPLPRNAVQGGRREATSRQPDQGGAVSAESDSSSSAGQANSADSGGWDAQQGSSAEGASESNTTAQDDGSWDGGEEEATASEEAAGQAAEDTSIAAENNTTSGSSPSADETSAAADTKTEMRIKTREELLRELLEE